MFSRIASILWGIFSALMALCLLLTPVLSLFYSLDLLLWVFLLITLVMTFFAISIKGGEILYCLKWNEGCLLFLGYLISSYWIISTEAPHGIQTFLWVLVLYLWFVSWPCILPKLDKNTLIIALHFSLPIAMFLGAYGLL